ncbi:MAG: hypothetical protein GKR89_15130 [Candidatus Latescibacteria bacterium]|nr:hypothetical protein [Candidatus Latescibacterota bacterium]
MHRPIYLAALTWFILALVAGGTGLIDALPPLAVPLVLWTLVATLLLLLNFWPLLRQWADGLDVRALVGLHVLRFVGFYFLYLHAQGRLPYAFAVPGGWGDIAVASLALPLLFFPGRRALWVWNIFGLVDILFVVATAGRLVLADPNSMHELTVLPLSLLPTFLVPLIIVSHLVLFWRLRRRSS